MADTRFRLLRLPFLVLCVILDLYGPRDIVQLSLCSKRSLRVAKKCWKKRFKVEAYLQAYMFPNINFYFFGFGVCYRFLVFETQDIREDQQVYNIRIGDALVPSIHSCTETLTFWKDKFFGMEQIVSYIKDLFDVPITKIDLEAEAFENEFIRTMDCIMKVQGFVQNCTINTTRPFDECLTHLLDNCKTGKLFIDGEPTRHFRHNWNITLDGLYMTNGLSFTLQNLTNINCRYLELRQSSLTSGDANQFLKHWQNGGNSRIRYACIKIYSMSLITVVSGIRTVPQPRTLHKTYPFTRIIKSGGLDIQRNDGTTGTVYMANNFFEFGVDPIKVFTDEFL